MNNVLLYRPQFCLFKRSWKPLPKIDWHQPNQNLAYNKMIENSNSIVTASKQSLFLLNYSKWINHFYMKPLYSLFFHSSLHIEEHILWIKLYLSTKRCFFPLDHLFFIRVFHWNHFAAWDVFVFFVIIPFSLVSSIY